MSGGAPTAELDWSPEGPRSRRFDDIYFTADGLAESRAVFLTGCGLPEAWRGRRRFTVAELGFGTGLNVLALLHLWRRTRPEGALLNVFSVEAYPLLPTDAARALAAFPQLADLAQMLLAQWPRTPRGADRIDLPEIGATIDVAAAEAAEALREWSGAADAWFLDGFAPSKNPDMWRDEVLDLVAARSAPGARLATFTVAGAVRRGLSDRGFAVSRAVGHGHKRERLEAVREGCAEDPSPARVAIVGAGIAGASLARAFRARGVDPLVFDPDPGGGASGNPSALVSPRLDVSGGPAARLYAQAWGRATDLYAREAADAVLARGALRLAAATKDPARFEALVASPLFRPGALQRLDASAATEQLGERSAEEALLMADALTVAPGVVVEAWAGDVVRGSVAEVRATPQGWALHDEQGRLLCETGLVCLAGGSGMNALAGLKLIEPVRGQATWSEALDLPVAAASWGGYAVATAQGGVLFGATHEPGSDDTQVRAEDEARSLAGLAERLPALAAAAAKTRLTSRASIRAAARDRLPLAGALEPRLFVLGGLGGRGFTTAPLLAEHVAALATGAPSPLAHTLAALVDPRRFAGRDGRTKIGASGAAARKDSGP